MVHHEGLEGVIQLSWIPSCCCMAASQRTLLSNYLNKQVCSLQVQRPSSAVLFPDFLQILNFIALYSLQLKMPPVTIFVSSSQSVDSKSYRETPSDSLSNICTGNVSPHIATLGCLHEATVTSQQLSGRLRPPINTGACRWEASTACLEKASSPVSYQSRLWQTSKMSSVSLSSPKLMQKL